MPDFAVPASVVANQQTRALARRPMPCGEGVGRGLTCNRYPAVLYPRGHRCGPCAQRAGLQSIATEPGVATEAAA